MNLTTFFANFNSVEVVLSGVVLVIGGGIATYFLIHYEVNKNLRDTIDIYKEELEVMSKKITRLQEDVASINSDNAALMEENKLIKFKKNYLKDIVMQALASKKSIDKSLIDEMIKGQK